VKEKTNMNRNYIDQNRAKTLLEKWAPVLNYSSKSIAPIEDERTRINTAIMLENQEGWCRDPEGGLLMENNYSGQGAFGSAAGGTVYNPPGTIRSNDGYATNDARLPKILIPMIRRTFPELISNEIVGVQPMSGPVGLAFALRYKYNSEGLGTGQIDAGRTSPGTHTAVGNADTQELGYQFIDTRFTGTSSSQLSGGDYWNFAAQDQGVAEILKNWEINNNIPQVDISFEKTAVEAGTRRLGARWSVELEQDLKNMNGIDVDAEITNAMAYEIQAEIDREMIVRMIQTCLNTSYGVGFSVWSPASADGRWLVERNRDFYQRLIIEANRIAVRNRRGAANFIVCTPRVAAILEMLPEFQWVPVQGNVNTQPVGIAKVGNLGGRFNVYRDTRTEVQNTGKYGDNGYSDGSIGATSRGAYTQGVEYALLGYKGP
jgi:hypothetical protein